MVTQHGQDSSPSDDCDCVICLETIVSADAEGVRPFNCIHRVHGWCAQTLVCSDYGLKCPSCRAPAIVGDLGLSRQYRALPSQPISLVDLSTEDKIMFIANAFGRDGVDSMKLADLVESVNSFLLHEGMEVCTKMVLLSELYSLKASVLAMDNAFIEIRIPSVRVVFLDAESLQTVSEWEERKRRAAAKEAQRVELANARALEEQRLMREHRLELDRQIAKLRTPAGHSEASAMSSTPLKSQTRTDSASSKKACAKPQSAGVRTAELAPADAFSLMCRRAGAYRAPTQNEHVKRRCLSTTSSREHLSEPSRTPRRSPQVEGYELEIVSDAENQVELGSDQSSSSSSSSSTSDSSSSSSEQEQRATLNRRRIGRGQQGTGTSSFSTSANFNVEFDTGKNIQATPARENAGAYSGDVCAKGKENKRHSPVRRTFRVSVVAGKSSSQSASASAASVSSTVTGSTTTVLRPIGMNPTVKHVVFSSLRSGHPVTDLDD